MRSIFKPPESLKDCISFKPVYTDSEIDGLVVAKMWNAWYNAGNPRGDELQRVFIDNQPLGYWLNLLKERSE